MLTEDILSAYKVSKAGYWGWCMLGTALPSTFLSRILRDNLSVHIWLDNDLPPMHRVNRGQIAAGKIIKTLRSMGVPFRNHLSDRDPKLLPLATIKEILS